MSIPNFLSLFRILLVPVTVILLIDGSFLQAFVVFSLAGVTDALDGFFARIWNQKTTLGAYLDPIADKALLNSCFITLAILGIIPGWIAVIVVSRDCIILVGISILFMASVSFQIKPVLLSKITTAVQLITVLLALAFKSLGGDGHPLFMQLSFWLTAAFTTVSGFHYITKGIRAINHS